MKIIVQAGGKGTRLGSLTKNKPKCLVSINNLPIIFHIFNKFKEADFIIIGDYLYSVLENYLAAFGSDYRYKLVKAQQKGTISGIKEALEYLGENESFAIVWSDLILADDFKLPTKPGNYVGISKSFECRWSFVKNKFIKEPSQENGVAGFFIFENKKTLKDIPSEKAFVGWLSKQDISFSCLSLEGSKEIGTLASYEENISRRRCRPFNKIEFIGNKVIKEGIDAQGKKIAVNEVNWYKFVKKHGFKSIPEIYQYEPLIMEKVIGKNIWEYSYLTQKRKEDMLISIVELLRNVHDLVPAQPVCVEDVNSEFLVKTFDRLERVEKLIPLTQNEFIKINGSWYKNVFFDKEKFSKVFETMIPESFHLIHGDCTFSNIMFDTVKNKPLLIDPRGYFGKTKLFGDADYDWAKLFYSLKGNYDQFNRKCFSLDIFSDRVELAIGKSNWDDMEDFFFDIVKDVSRQKIKALQSIIWMSLSSYAWEDYDSVCAAFYNGIMHAGETI